MGSPSKELAADTSRSYYERHREEILARHASPEYRKRKRASDRKSYKRTKERNKEKLRKRQQHNYKENGDALRKKARECYAADPDRAYFNGIKSKYGVTREQYQSMYEAQFGKCAICLGPPNGRSPRLVVDHDHDTMKVRGLLCSKCNSAIGMLRDDPTILERAGEYLKKVDDA